MTQSYLQAAPPLHLIRVAPVVTPTGLTRLPLLLIFAYVVATFALFLIWPINWPIFRSEDWLRLIAYVLLCFTVVGGTSVLGSSGATRVVAPLPHLTFLLVAGATLSALLLIPFSFAYTGHGPWEVLDSLRDQGGAYRRLQAQIVATTGQRNLVVLMRAAAAPLTYAVLPLGIIRWRTIGWPGRLAVVAAAAASAVFSVMRGTDKEIADLFVVGGAAAFVSLGRSSVIGRQRAEVIRRAWMWAAAAAVFFYLAQGLFTDRKEARLGGYAGRAAVCANDSRICADLGNRWIAWLPLKQRFGATVFILSTCSGYYGLELAMEKPFESAYGVGHSPATLSAYEAATGDRTPLLSTYTYRNAADRWPQDYYWSTLMTWIANDVGFVGAVVVLGGLGYLWGRWWREAAAGLSDPAAVLFTLATTAMFYLPANNQVLASYDGYVVVGAWTVVWLWSRARQAVSAGVGGVDLGLTGELAGRDA